MNWFIPLFDVAAQNAHPWTPPPPPGDDTYQYTRSGKTNWRAHKGHVAHYILGITPRVFGAGATSKHRWSGAVRNGFSGKTITLGALVTRASRNPVSLMLIELRMGRWGGGVEGQRNQNRIKLRSSATDCATCPHLFPAIWFERAYCRRGAPNICRIRERDNRCVILFVLEPNPLRTHYNTSSLFSPTLNLTKQCSRKYLSLFNLT